VEHKDIAQVAALAEQIQWRQAAQAAAAEAAYAREAGLERQARRLERYAARYRRKLARSIKRHGNLLIPTPEDTARRIIHGDPL
jgi:hypothetical protein